MASSWQERYEELKKKKKVEDMLGGTSDIAPIKSTIRTSPKKSTKTKKTSTIKNTIPNARNPQFLINKNNSKKATYTNTGKYNTLVGTPSSLNEMRNSMSLNNNDPFKTRTSRIPYSAPSKNKKSWFDGWFKSGTLSDGYQFGDITKNILGTTADAGISVGKGIFGLGEGLVDLGRYGISGAADFFGADEYAKEVKERAKENTKEKIFGGIQKKVDKYSILGEKSDNVAESLGYVAGIIGTGGLGSVGGLGATGTTILTTGVTGASGMGSGMSEAYEYGATDEEAIKYGLINGASEAGTELLFGGLGKSVNALGLSKGALGVDDALAKKVSGKFKSHLAKNLTQYTIKSGAEGLEEVIAGVTQGIGKKLTYMSEEDLGKILEDEKLLDQFISGAVTSGIAQSPHLVKTTKSSKDFVTGYTDNEQKVVDSLVEEQSNEKAKQKAIENAINEAIKTRETEQKGILSTKEKTALTEGIKAKIEAGEIDVSNNKLSNKEISKIREEVEESLQKGTLDTNKIDSILGNTITEQDGLLAKSYQETAKKSEVFAYDSKKITDEQEKSVYDSATKYFNNTTRSHEFVEKVAKISKEKGTNYGFINNEELQSLGHDVEGKQVNGLVRTTQDGKQTVLINVDSPKALNTIVGHETTHLLEGTQEYKDLQEAIFNYAKEKGDFDSRQKALNSLYEGIDNANVDSELTADLVGDYLFTDEKFINSLSTQKPTVFQKIKSLIDDLVIKFKGTKEEKALREVQKKFKEAYRQTNKIPELVEPDVEIRGIKFNTKKYEYGVGGPDLVKTLKNGMNQKQEYLNDLINEMSTKNTKKETTDVQYSINDNQGRTLTKEQQEFFKDVSPEVKDESGNLKVLYHGSNVTDTTVFTKDKFGNRGVTFLTDDPDIADTYRNKDGKRYEFYADIKNPLIVDAKGSYWSNIDYFGDGSLLATTDEIVQDALNGGILDVNGKFVPYDGVIFKNVIDRGKHIHKAIGNRESTIYAVFNSNQIKNTDNINPTKDSDVRYSLTDNQGRELSKEQQEYFKDSKVRDENGNLKVAYHNTTEATKQFNVFDSRKYYNNYNEDNIIWFTDSEEMASSYSDGEYEIATSNNKSNKKNKYQYQTYLNIKNPFIVDVKGRTYTQALVDNENSIVYSSEGVVDLVLEKNKNGSNYDGIIFKNIIDYNDDYEGIRTPHDDYVVFNSNQIKNVDNTNPTSDADIRYSLSDNKGNILSPNMAERMKNSKVRDENGNLKVVYHGTNADFSIFDYGKIGNNGIQEGIGFYFSDSDKIADMYNKEGKVIQAYIDISNPVSTEEITLTRKQLRDVINDLGEKADDFLWNYGDIDYDRNSVINDAIDSLLNYEESDRGIVTELAYHLEAEDVYKSLKKITGHDGIIVENYNDSGTSTYVVFGQNQIKDITNENPTDNPDINMSLSKQGEQIAPTGNYNVYGEDIKYQEAIAPLQEEIQTLTESVNELKEQLAPVKEEVEEVKPQIEYTQPTKEELDNLMSLEKTGGTEYANTFFGLRDKYGQANLYKGINQYKKAPDTYEAPIKGDEFAPIPQNIVEQQGQEAFNNIDESSMPSEVEDTTPDTETEITSSKSLFETRNYEDVGNRKVNAYQYDNPEVKPYFQEEAQSMLGDLEASIKGKRQYNDQLYYESGGEQGFYGVERQTTNEIAELLDGLDGKYKLSYEDIRKGLNAIINDEGAENNAASKRIEFYLDQRLRNGYTTVDGVEVPANSEYLNTLRGKEFDNFYNSLPINEDMIPYDDSNSDILAPIKGQNAQKTQKTVQKLEKSTPRTTEASIPEPINKAYQLTLDGKAKKIVDNSSYNEIAEVLTNEPKTENDRNKRKWAIFKANVLDKGAVFEDLSLKNKNRDLMGKWDYTLTSEARGQNAIGQGHFGYDPDTKTTKQLSKSLNDIRAEVENTGLTKEFYEYVYHKHNVDRMTLDKRFGMENKPVFGNVSAAQSQAIVNKYENTHPEFMDYAQDVYDYVNADKQQLVDSGVISQETADLWSQMYPHYVPTRRTTDVGLDINVPLDTNRTGINAPVKKATGGSADILPLFDTMAMRTLQTYRATAKNSFGVELMNTLGTKLESNQTNVDEVIDSIDAQEDLLQEGKKGRNPTFTVFENGEKSTFEITKDMYDALKPLSDSSPLSKTIKPLNVAGNVHRGLLTEFNPTFMLTNAIKDTQDILINSQHVARTYAKIPEAHKQILTKGYWYQEYIANGGEQNSYFDSQDNTFKTKNKGLKKILDIPPLSTISKINNYIEMIPRLSEYIASREMGRSVETSMLDAARVTTNFKAGGNLTKALNRNGATFLNASVQGAMQQVRNVREAKANGLKGWMGLATKFAVAGLPAVLLNNLVWEDDEEYEELSDYVKQNYYVVAKDDNGNFIRIPKGRTVAVIQEGINQMSNLATGDDETDFGSFINLALSNLAPNNPIENNVFSPITQVATNTAWYGGDLVPKRLQDLPAAEQYDESTDEFSKWVGKTFNVSPYKVNYLLNQYSGGVGDVLMPMITPEAKNDAETVGDYLIAPIKDKFTTNATFNNQNISDFYDLNDKLYTNSKKANATDEDILKNKYVYSVNTEMNELYKEKREIQNSNLPKSEKYEKVKEIQEQINELAKNAITKHTNVKSLSNYAQVADKEYYKYINSEGVEGWSKVKDEEADDLENLNLTTSEKNTYFKAKTDISSIKSDDNDYQERKIKIIDIIKDTGFTDNQKAYMYKKYYNSDTVDTVVSSGIDIDAYFDYTSKEFKADKDSEGKSISGSRKKKVINYINSLDLSIPEKAILIKATNTFKFNEYNNDIVKYVSELDISYEDKVSILEELDMEVLDDGRVKWE